MTSIKFQNINPLTYMENPYKNIIIDLESKLISASYSLEGNPQYKTKNEEKYLEDLAKLVEKYEVKAVKYIDTDENNHIRYCIFEF